MKNLILILAAILSAQASFASDDFQAEQRYLDCIDYGHQKVSAEKDKACREAAQSQDDNYDEVVPPYPVPAGEVRLDALKEIKLTENLVLTAYVEKNDREASVYAMGDTSVEVSCNLSASNVSLSNFEVLKKEFPGGSGARVYLSLKKDITLNFKTSLQGVEESKPWCNGEPEMCDEQSKKYVYRTQIIATDRTGNSSWNLNCVAPFSRPVFASDVKINGIKIK